MRFYKPQVKIYPEEQRSESDGEVHGLLVGVLGGLLPTDERGAGTGNGIRELVSTSGDDLTSGVDRETGGHRGRGRGHVKELPIDLRKREK